MGALDFIVVNGPGVLDHTRDYLTLMVVEDAHGNLIWLEVFAGNIPEPTAYFTSRLRAFLDELWPNIPRVISFQISFFLP